MPGQWITETGVPAFRPHVRKDKDGNVLYEVTAADIPEIARNSARVSVELHGNKPPITEGHRNFAPDAKEADQPLVFGYLDNFRTGSLPDGTPCVLCDRHYMAQHAERAKRHPFCSVDYVHQLKAIVGLAKLTRPPALNLGAVYYPGTQYPVYVYAMNDQTPAPTEPQTPELTPEEIQGCEKVMAYFMSKYAWVKTVAEKYSSAPSATNTNMPEADSRAQPEPEPEPEPAKKDDEAEKYQAEAAGLKVKLAEVEVDRLLDRLELVERYQFDRGDERARLIPLDDAAREKRLSEIRKYHPQLPGGHQIEVYQGDPTGRPKAATQEQMNKALAYSERNKVPYADALAAVKAGKS